LMLFLKKKKSKEKYKLSSKITLFFLVCA